MKYTIEEIEKMLSEISAWPWAAEEMGPIIWSFNGNLIVEKPEFEINLSIKSDIDIQFIKNTPEIISDLVKEVKAFKGVVDQMSSSICELKKENKSLRETLDKMSKAYYKLAHLSGFDSESLNFLEKE